MAVSPLFAVYPAQAATFSNDYPDMDAVDCSNQFGLYSWCKEEDGQQGYVLNEAKSSRGFYYRNCVDAAAYWVKQYTGVIIPGSWGSAVNWDNAATSYTVKDGTAINSIEPGDIAQSDDGGSGHGHVGFVTSVSKDSNGNVTSIMTAELNGAGTGLYSTPTYSNKNASGKLIRSGSNDWDHFIDVNGAGKGLNNEAIVGGSSSSAYSDGTFLKVNESQAIYRVVGGAPIRIYNQGALSDFNGTVTNVSHATLGSLPSYPNDDGDIINLPEAGNAKYRFVGGAPVRIYDCSPIPGNCAGAISVNFQSLVDHDHMLTRPKDGSVISIAEAGGSGVYEFVGGAPIRQYNWGAIPQFGAAITVNFQSLTTLDHMNSVPADGAVVSIVEAGGSALYRFVGGAPVRLYNWGAIPDMPNAVGINFQSLTEHDHMNFRPADGSVINIVEAGGSGIYVFAGGAPMRLYNWGPIPNMRPAVGVNFQSLTELDHMNAQPTNGTFIKSLETGVVYRIAGGAALRLYNPSGIPGFSAAVVVNQQTIDTNDHLLVAPADGTVIMGVTSQTYWQITEGKRIQVPAQSSAVVVDEQTVTNIPQA